ncbi:hypothetical protein BJY00DRAFT_307841 [Aspergillus carlsbadensis]|nr:hypothetical protein BJY00DRAFT_307841 [Aspergillus carlsbadensis]
MEHSSSSGYSGLSRPGAFDSFYSALRDGPSDTPPASLREDRELFQIDNFLYAAINNSLPIVDVQEFDGRYLLGSGKTMTVYETRWTSRSRTVALKCINFQPALEEWAAEHESSQFQHLLQSAATEIRVLTSEAARRHPNIADLLAVSWQEIQLTDGQVHIHPALVMERAHRLTPTLDILIGRGIGLSVRLELLRDVLDGIAQIHSMHVVHGDIKPENILIFDTGVGRPVAKISDFGFSKLHPSAAAGGTEYWNAPECLSNELGAFAHSHQRDIYSYGLLVCYVLLEELPIDRAAHSRQNVIQLKLLDRISSLILERWRVITVSGACAVSDIMDDTEVEARIVRWEVYKSGQWQTTGTLPIAVMKIIAKMLVADPNERADVGNIQDVLSTYTAETRDLRYDWEKQSTIQNFDPRHLESFPPVSTPILGTPVLYPIIRCHESIPHALRHPLYQHFLANARRADAAARINAMVDIGYCKVKAFGTTSDLVGAAWWLSQAAQAGSSEARETIFQLEHLLKQSMVDIIPGLKRETLVSWIIESLIRDVPSSLIPEDIDVDAIQSRMRETLLRMKPEIVENGLRRALEDDVIRLLAIRKRDYSPQLNLFPGVREAIIDDDVGALHLALQPLSGSMTTSLKENIVLAAAQERSLTVLRALLHRWHFKPRDGFTLALTQALMQSDTGMAALLLNLRIPWSSCIGAEAMDFYIKGCSIPTVSIAFLIQSTVQVQDSLGASRYTEHDILRRMHLDGIFPAQVYKHDGEIEDNFHPPLFAAIAFNRVHTLRMILALGGNPNVRYQGMTPLHFAVRTLRPFLVALLLAFGADPNARLLRGERDTALHTVSSFKILALQPEDKDQYYDAYNVLGDKFQPSPQFVDEDNHHRRLIIELLLAYGADPKAVNSQGATPFISAMASEQLHAMAVMRHLIDAGAACAEGASDTATGLHIAVFTGNMQMVQYLIHTSPTNLQNSNNMGVTPLIFAAMIPDREACLATLLESGADVAARGNHGRNALAAAIKSMNKPAFELLLSHIEKLSARLRNKVFLVDEVANQTAIHCALECQASELRNHFFSSLLPLMPQLQTQDRAGLTVLHGAVLKGYIQEVQLLLNHGANPNLQGPLGMTALHLAYADANKEMAACFQCLEHLDTQILNHFGFRPAAFGEAVLADASLLQRLFEEIEKRYQISELEHTHQESKWNEMSASRQIRLAEESQYVSEDRFTRGFADNMTEIEHIHLGLVESAARDHGPTDYETLRRLLILGGVYERYGRLTKALKSYQRVWDQTSAEPENEQGLFLAQDSANKLLRVLYDLDMLGAEEVLVSRLKAWVRRTLRNGARITGVMRRKLENHGVTEGLARSPLGWNVKVLCRVYRYCSTSCLHQGQTDGNSKSKDTRAKASTHVVSCFPSLTATEHPSIVTTRMPENDPRTIGMTSHIIESIIEGRGPAQATQSELSVTATHMHTAAFFIPQRGIVYRIKGSGPQTWREPPYGTPMVVYYDTVM